MADDSLKILGSDAELDALLSDQRPIFLLVTNGNKLDGEFSSAYRRAASTANRDILYARVDPAVVPGVIARFNVSADKPTLLAYYCGEEIARRVKPWSSDLKLVSDQIAEARREDAAPPISQPVSQPPKDSQSMSTPSPLLSAPVAVTDQASSRTC